MTNDTIVSLYNTYRATTVKAAIADGNIPPLKGSNTNSPSINGYLNISKVLAGAMDVRGSEREEYLRVYNEIMKGIAVGNGWRKVRMVEVTEAGSRSSECTNVSESKGGVVTDAPGLIAPLETGDLPK